MEVDTALDVINRGPRGGNLQNPDQDPHERQKSFNGESMSGGGLSLHRHEGWHDTAVAGIKNEKPWHRMAAYMIIAQRTNSEIAVAAGVLPGEVAILKSQRWFQELLATIANNDGDEVLGLLKSEAFASVEKLVFLRDCGEDDKVRLSAAKNLLEFAYGKATQKVVSLMASTSYSSPAEELENIDSELSALRRQNNAGLGDNDKLEKEQ